MWDTALPVEREAGGFRSIPRSSRLWIGWLAVAALATFLMLLFRGRLDKVHVALLYMLLVLGASSHAGRALGWVLALLTFLAFNFFFLPPFYTLYLADPFDWVVLVAYLVTASVAAHVTSRAEREAAERLRLAGQAEKAKTLLEADRLKDALLAAVSHDLRTPLTTIKALAEDMAAEGDERAAAIAEEGERLSHLVGDLLDFSSLRGGAVRVHPEINAVEDLLGAAIQQTSGSFRDSQIIATVDTNEPVLLARFDFVHTLRIVVNLLDNARKYSPPGVAVELSAVRKDSRVVISVADRGPGVPEHEEQRIFQPFYRVPGLTPDIGGAGLGLAIALGLAEAQQATLRYHPRQGGGSLFSLSLPAAEAPSLIPS